MFLEREKLEMNDFEEKKLILKKNRYVTIFLINIWTFLTKHLQLKKYRIILKAS